MKLTFLGTSSMVPTRDRSHPAAFLELEPYGLLLDCGEGTQRQFKLADIRPTRITHILLTHWHGDHTLGLPGLLQTLSAMNHGQKITIVGPKGTKIHLGHMMKAFIFSDADLDLTVIEVSKNPVLKTDGFVLESYPLKHNVPVVGYRITERDRIKVDSSKLEKLGIKEGPWLKTVLQGKSAKVKGKTIKPSDVTFKQKGKIVALVTDTELTPSCYDIAKDVDLLICEASFASKHEEKALQYSHLTAIQAAQLASQSNVNKLVLTHFSQRYKSVAEIIEEAKGIFPDTAEAFDFMKVRI